MSPTLTLVRSLNRHNGGCNRRIIYHAVSTRWCNNSIATSAAMVAPNEAILNGQPQQQRHSTRSRHSTIHRPVSLHGPQSTIERNTFFHCMIPSFSRRHRRLAYFHSTVRNMDTNNKIYLKACWNDDDLQEGDIVQSQLTLEDIQQQAVDMFGLYSDDDSNNANHQLSTLEYYNGHDWRPLTQQAIGSEIRNNTLATSSSLPLPIRIPSLFDEEYGLNNEFIKLRKATPEDTKQEGNMPSPEQMQLKDVIEFLHRRLLEEGYTRHVNVDSSFNGKKQSDESVDTLGAKSTNSSDSTFANWRHTVEVDSVHMPTRDWILEQASSDMEVRSILLSQPGALQHVTQALHYPFL